MPNSWSCKPSGVITKLSSVTFVVSSGVYAGLGNLVVM